MWPFLTKRFQAQDSVPPTETLRSPEELAQDIAPRERTEEGLRVRARQQTAVAELGQLALSGLSFDELLTRSAELIAQGLGVEFAGVWQLLPGSARLMLCAGAGWKGGLIGCATIESGTG